MSNGLLGQICTPAAGNKVTPDVDWIADNGIFGDTYPGDEAYLAWLASRPHLDRCRFAVAPDVVGDHEATLARSLPMLARIRALVPVAFVGQDGATPTTVPWDEFDVLFIGGSTAWKLSLDAYDLVRAAHLHGKWVHIGRVNSRQRLQYAGHIDADSADGTYLAYGPDINLPKLLDYLGELDLQGRLW